MIEIFIIILILLSIFYYVLQKRIVGLLKIITKFIEFSGYYFTYKLHKKKVSKKSKSLSLNNFAIVIQGPNVLNSNFTLETLRYYSTQYPKSPIIFSSWEHDINIIKKYKLNKNIHLVTNETPSYSGIRNINLQSYSTKNAILYAKKLKCKYVLKTRSDTRVYFNDFQNHLINLIKFYKLKKNFREKQKARIVSTNFTLRYRMYAPSDLIMFGHIDDLYDYFNVLTSERVEKNFFELIKKSKFKSKSHFFYDDFFTPEQYFFCNFFKKKNLKLKWTVDDYLKKISENFIIIDNQTLNIYWKKSNRVDNSFSDTPNVTNSSLSFNFVDWLEYFYKNNKIKKL